MSAPEIGSAFGAGVYIRPIEPRTLVYTPAIAFQEGEKGEFLMRIGGSYDAWRSDDFLMGPAVYCDIHHDRLNGVFGLNFGRDS